MRTDMLTIVSKYLPLLEELIHEEALRFFVPVSPVSCCASMLRIIDGMIEVEGLHHTSSSRLDMAACEMMVAFAAVWGYGGALAVDRVIDGRTVRWHVIPMYVCMYVCT
jgi:hypothetical protein